MDFEKLNALAFKYMGKRKSHKEREMGAAYFHGQRVANGVIELRKRLFDDSSMDDILRCAGIFHDITKGIEPHPRTGAVLVRDLLKDELTAGELDEVCRLIAAHGDKRPDTDIHSWDEKLLQDADVLDHYGSQGIWMCVSYYAYMTQQEMAQLPVYYETEWPQDIERNLNKLNYDISKEIFKEKAAFEKSVADRMRIEKDGRYVFPEN